MKYIKIFNIFVIILFLQLPIKILQFNIGDYVIVYKDVITFLLLFLSLLKFKQKILHFNKKRLYLFILILISLVSVLFIYLLKMNDIFNIFWHFRNDFLLPIVIVLYLSTLETNKLSDIFIQFIFIIKVFMIINIILTMMQIYFGNEFYSIFHIPLGDKFIKNASVLNLIRPIGIFRSPDMLGFFAYFSFFIFLLIKENVIWKILSLFLLLFSTSKTSILMLLTLIIIIPVIKFKTIRLFMFFLPIVFIFYFQFLNDMLLHFFSLLIDDKDLNVYLIASLLDRINNIWDSSYNNFFYNNDIINMLFGASLSDNSITKDNLFYFVLLNYGTIFFTIFFITMLYLSIKNKYNALLIIPIFYAGIFLDIIENLIFQVFFFLVLVIINRRSCK